MLRLFPFFFITLCVWSGHCLSTRASQKVRLPTPETPELKTHTRLPVAVAHLCAFVITCYLCQVSTQVPHHRLIQCLVLVTAPTCCSIKVRYGARDARSIKLCPATTSFLALPL